MLPRVIALIGPTASGKSSLAIALARHFDGEIVSADSRQVYRGLNLGSGKVSQTERRKIPHFLLDVANPKRTYTAAHFTRDGRRAIQKILRHKKVPFVVGGTGFWIDALLRGQSFPDVPPNPLLRKRLATFSPAQLYAKLKHLDPQRAKTIDAKNPVRLIRALEILATTGTAIPQQTARASHAVLWLGLKLSKKNLHQRIHKRLHQRLRQGLIAEVRGLLRKGVPAKRLLALGLEYRFVTLYLQGKLTKIEMRAQLERAIQQYAKRQMTWFKRHDDIHWITSEAQARRIVGSWLERNP